MFASEKPDCCSNADMVTKYQSKHSIMNRLKLCFVALIVGLTSFAAHAEWYNEITFVVGSGANAPITVRYNGKSYSVYSSVTINTVGNTYSPSATDRSGRSLRYKLNSETQTRGSDTYHYYTYTFYSGDSYDSSYGSSSSGGYGNSNGGRSYESAERAGRAIAHGIFQLGGTDDGDAYPSMQIGAGISWGYGENIRLRYTGHGFHAYGSIGKDFLFDSKYKNKILWNFGIGSYFNFGGNGNPNMDVSLGLSIGQLAQWKKLSLMIDVGYTYWIGRWRRVGIFAGGGLGWGSFTEVFNTDDYSSTGGFAWNLEAGILIRIASF